MKDSQGKRQKSQFWEWVIIGLILIAAGLFSLLDLKLVSSLLPTVLGLAAILAGSIYAVVYIGDSIRGGKGRSTLTKAVVPVVVGLLLLIKPAETIKYLVVATGLFFVVNALFTTIAALVMRAYRKGLFWFLFVIALLLLLTGLLIIFAPTALGIPVGAVIGAGLILNGLLFLLKAAADIIGKGKREKELPPQPASDENPQ